MSRMLRYRHLLWQLVRRELMSRYRSSILGALWALMTPLLMLLVYAMVFGEIFRMRWSAEATESRGEFALLLFAGMLVFNFFSECLSRAPLLIVQHANYVKKVVFPLALLPLAAMLASLVHALVSMLILMIGRWFVYDSIPVTALLFPVVLLPVVFLVMGFGWFLSSLGVYIRDISQIMGILLTGMMFLSPVFYPSSQIPERWRAMFALNPLSVPIEQARETLVLGRVPALAEMFSGLLIGLMVALAGFVWFHRTRSGFADVL